MSISVEKQAKIDALLLNCDKQFGKGSLQIGEAYSTEFPTICSYGSLNVDLASGIMGVPRGRIGEIYGPESSGKTTLALHIIAECQKAGGVAAFVDAEHALDKTWAKKLGVNTDELLISQPDCGEDALEIVDNIVESGVIDIIIVDSVAALVPKAELEGEMSDQQMGAQARMMGKAMRKLTAKISKSNCTVIFINQLRMKIGVMFGSPETTAGGNALKFFASFRIDVRGSDIQKDDVFGQTSKTMTVKFIKNKLASPFKKAELVLNTDDTNHIYGFDKYQELIDIAVKHDLVKKSGTWFSYNDERMGQGKPNAAKFLIENKNTYNEIFNKIKEIVKKENEFTSKPDSFTSVLNEVAEEKATRTRKTKEVEGGVVIDAKTGEVIE